MDPSNPVPLVNFLPLSEAITLLWFNYSIKCSLLVQQVHQKYFPNFLLPYLVRILLNISALDSERVAWITLRQLLKWKFRLSSVHHLFDMVLHAIFVRASLYYWLDFYYDGLVSFLVVYLSSNSSNYVYVKVR